MALRKFSLNIQLFAEEIVDPIIADNTFGDTDVEKPIETVVETPQEQTETTVEETIAEVFKIDSSQFENLGSSEEVTEFLKDVLPENLTKSEQELVNKLLKKLNESSKDIVEEEQDVSVGEAVRTEVMDNLPMSDKDFRDLHSWVAKQPQEYRQKLAELTDYSSKTKEEIIQAISQANQDRLGSVGGAVRIDTGASGTFQVATKETILDDYKTIISTYTGQEQKNKIKELKNSSLSRTKGELNDWVKSFL